VVQKFEGVANFVCGTCDFALNVADKPVKSCNGIAFTLLLWFGSLMMIPCGSKHVGIFYVLL
jgi:hypothetical protein